MSSHFLCGGRPSRRCTTVHTEGVIGGGASDTFVDKTRGGRGGGGAAGGGEMPAPEGGASATSPLVNNRAASVTSPSRPQSEVIELQRSCSNSNSGFSKQSKHRLSARSPSTPSTTVRVARAMSLLSRRSIRSQSSLNRLPSKPGEVAPPQEGASCPNSPAVKKVLLHFLLQY